MNDKPEPVCKAFLVCREVVTEPNSGETILVGLPTGHTYHRFPTAASVGFFAQLTDARGEYLVEVRLQDLSGNVVWRDGPPDRLMMEDPLMSYNLNLNLGVVFQAPGDYEFVLVLNDRDVARQRFSVQLMPGH